MKTIQWNENLSVGIPLIDEQHQMLIQRLKDMAEAVGSHRGQEKIAKTLDFLVDYTRFHFSEEEKHMKSNHYPGAHAHIEKHGEFLTTLNDLVRDFEEEGAAPLLANALDNLLMNWLTGHIQTVDVEFGKFLLSKKIDLTA